MGKVEVQEQLLGKNVERLRGGLVFKAHRLVYHSTLGSRVMMKKKKFKVETWIVEARKRANSHYRGISRIRNSPPPKDHCRALGKVLQ